MQFKSPRLALLVLLCVIVGALPRPTLGLEIVSAPVGDTNAPEGTSFTFSVVATGEEPFIYQWFKQASPIEGVNSAELTLTNPQGADSGIYEVTVSDASGSSRRAGAVLIVRPKIPIVTSFSPSQSIPVGGELRLFVFVAAVSPVTYQWYRNGEPIPQGTGSEFDIPEATSQDAGDYTVKVSNTYGTSTSNSATVMVTEPPPPDPQVPFIKQAPRSTNGIPDGSSLELSVVATGTAPLTYQWYRDGYLISGAISSVLQLTDIQEADDGYYRVLVSNEFGSTWSLGAYVSVLPRLPRMIQSPASSDLIEGQHATLSAPALGVLPITYQWYRNGQAISNSFGGTFYFVPVHPSDAGSYHVVASNSYGSATSTVAVITVGQVAAPPVIWSFPQHPVYVNRDEPLMLIAYVSGSRPMEFQWFKNNIPVPSGNTSTLTIERSEVVDTGQYHLTARNSLGSVVSSFLDVTVRGTPHFTLQPVGKTGLSPAELPYILNVQASGAFPLRFIWYRDGQQVRESEGWWSNNEKRDSFLISGWADSGDYTIVAINGLGIATSDRVHVQVNVPTPKRPPTSDSPDLLAGLISYWSFDEIIDRKVEDLVGHYDLEIGGIPSYATPYVRAGRMGNALPLELTATYQTADSADELPVNKHAAFTVSFWAGFVQEKGGSIEHTLFYEGNATNSETFFALSAVIGPSLISYLPRFHIERNAAESTDIRGSRLILSDRSWHHLAIVQDADGTRWFYIDGEEDELTVPNKATGAWNLNLLRFGGMTGAVAGRLSANFGYFPNYYKMDDAAVWKRALSVEEIRLLMKNGIPGIEPKRLTIESLSFDQEGKTLTLHWNAASSAWHSLLVSTDASGPWTTVTNAYPSGPNGFTVTNAFTGLEVSGGAMFYKIQQSDL